MDLFEYQGKQFFASFGIPVSAGEAVTTVDDAVAAAERLGYPVVVKAQVQVGGRGKAGGIKLANNADEAREHATAILGMDIKGHTVQHRLDRGRLRHRRGVLRQLHPRPLGQEAPRDAQRPGRRRHRGGGRRRPRRHRQGPRRPGRRPQRGRRPGVGRGREARTPPPPTARSTSCRSSTALHRGRRRPGRDQPADPHPGRPGPRPGRQGHPGRQRRLPPRVGRVRGHPGARRAGAGGPREGPAVRRPRRHGRASSPTAPAWP